MNMNEPKVMYNIVEEKPMFYQYLSYSMCLAYACDLRGCR